MDYRKTTVAVVYFLAINISPLKGYEALVAITFQTWYPVSLIWGA